MENVYSWSRLTPLESVRVVVLGQVRRSHAHCLPTVFNIFLQDPYHDVGQAHGNWREINYSYQ